MGGAKNSRLTRYVVGDQRLEGLVAVVVLGELFGAWRLLTNLYQPSFKRNETPREEAKRSQRHHPLRTPMQRSYSSRQRTLFAEHQEPIERWLESDVALRAVEFFRRLMALAPGTCHEG